MAGRRHLTERQAQVLDAISAGLSNKEIAARLHFSEHAAKWHVSRLLRLFEAGNRAGLVRSALIEGMIGETHLTPEHLRGENGTVATADRTRQ